MRYELSESAAKKENNKTKVGLALKFLLFFFSTCPPRFRFVKICSRPSLLVNSHGLIQLRDWIRSILGTLQFAHPPGVLIIRRSVCSLRAVATTAVMAADVFLRYLEKDNRHEYNKVSCWIYLIWPEPRKNDHAAAAYVFRKVGTDFGSVGLIPLHESLKLVFTETHFICSFPFPAILQATKSAIEENPLRRTKLAAQHYPVAPTMMMRAVTFRARLGAKSATTGRIRRSPSGSRPEAVRNLRGGH